MSILTKGRYKIYFNNPAYLHALTTYLPDIQISRYDYITENEFSQIGLDFKKLRSPSLVSKSFHMAELPNMVDEFCRKYDDSYMRKVKGISVDYISGNCEALSHVFPKLSVQTLQEKMYFHTGRLEASTYYNCAYFDYILNDVSNGSPLESCFLPLEPPPTELTRKQAYELVIRANVERGLQLPSLNTFLFERNNKLIYIKYGPNPTIGYIDAMNFDLDDGFSNKETDFSHDPYLYRLVSTLNLFHKRFVTSGYKDHLFPDSLRISDRVNQTYSSNGPISQFFKTPIDQKSWEEAVSISCNIL